MRRPKRAIKKKGVQWQKVIDEAGERDDWTCLCGLAHRPVMVPHHIILKGELRIDHVDNILTMCKPCHDLLHAGNLIIDGVRITTRCLKERYRYRIEKFLIAEKQY